MIYGCENQFDISIKCGPRKLINSRDAFFYFTCNRGDCIYECQLDGGGFSYCTSPKIFSELTAGEHTFEVRATEGFWIELLGSPPRLKVHLSIPFTYTSGYVFEYGNFPYICHDNNREIVFDLVPSTKHTKDAIYNTENIAFELGVEFSNNLDPTCSCWGACSTFGCEGMVLR